MSAVQNIPLRAVETPQSQSSLRTRILLALTVVTAVLVAFGLYLALGYAPSEAAQGEVQRIFYIHLAAFTGAFIAFSATVVGGVLYLRTRQVKWDTLALAGIDPQHTILRPHPARGDDYLALPNPFTACNRMLVEMGSEAIAW